MQSDALTACLLLLLLLLPMRWCFELLLKCLVSSIIYMLEGLKVRCVRLGRVDVAVDVKSWMALAKE